MSLRAFNSWHRQEPWFGFALDSANAVRVERSLYLRAIGYDFLRFQKRFKLKRIYNKRTKRYSWRAAWARGWHERVTVPPNVKACIAWLRNRRPEEWGDKKPPAAEMTIHIIAPQPPADTTAVAKKD
jgi:hypothetical protein